MQRFRLQNCNCAMFWCYRPHGAIFWLLNCNGAIIICQVPQTLGATGAVFWLHNCNGAVIWCNTVQTLGLQKLFCGNLVPCTVQRFRLQNCNCAMFWCYRPHGANFWLRNCNGAVIRFQVPQTLGATMRNRR